jgi:hypothetical protein
LVVAAALQNAIILLEKFKKIVALEEHIRKFQKSQAALFEARLETFGGKHLVDREFRARIPNEIHKIQLQNPIGVIDDYRGVFALEGYKFRHLTLKAFDIAGNRLVRHHTPHIRPPRRVADHSRRAAYQNDRLMPRPLHKSRRHKSQIMTDVEAVRRRVVADIKADGFFTEKLIESVGVYYLFDEAAFF